MKGPILAFVVPLLAPQPPANILKAAIDKYGALRTLQARSAITFVTYMPDTEIRVRYRSSLFFERPNRLFLAVETKSPMGAATNFKLVCDGKTLYHEMASLKQVKRSKAPPSLPEAFQEVAMGPVGMLSALILGLMSGEKWLLQMAPKAKVGEPETIGGVRTVPVVLPLPEEGKEIVSGRITFWFDPKTGLLRKASFRLGPEEEMGFEVIEELLSVEVDKPIPPERFKYSLPEGFKEVEEFEFGGERVEEGSWEGKGAPDFSLKSLDGTTYKLSALRGRVVLLDFWATWCPPCRRELPTIERLHRELGPKGLVVLAITDEDRKKVESFVRKQGYTFPILLDPGDEVFKLYKVEAIPTVLVIGRDGRVVAHFVGLTPEGRLREALKRAGIE